MQSVTVEIPEEIRAIINKPKDYLTAKEIAPFFLGVSDSAIRAQARAGLLPFPAVPIGQRVRIPKIPFLRYMGYDIKFDYKKEAS